MKERNAKVRKFGDDIDTDVIIPARYLMLPLNEMKAYAMAPVRPGFAASVRPGDVVVAGRNFGCGSSREQAPAVLKALGIKAVVAVSFARIFFRNAINLGLVVMESPDIGDHVQEGDSIEIDPEAGTIYLPEKNTTVSGTRLPDFLLEIVQSGGLVAHLHARLK
jgi:3-isopropylmalate/(R)-2-methylmalate dehydratase small subunit